MIFLNLIVHVGFEMETKPSIIVLHIIYVYCINIYILTSLNPEIISNDLNKALKDKDASKAKQLLCDMGTFSESECKERGNSSTITQVVDDLIKKKMDNPDERITNSQIINTKQGNIIITNGILT